MDSREMVEVEFGGVEAYHILYDIEKGGTNHKYSDWEQLHESNLQDSGGRVNVSINVDPADYEEISAETIERAEMMIAACLDKELDLLSAESRHGSDDTGLLL